MATKYIKAGKVLSLTAAGKLAMTAGAVSAQDDGGKGGTTERLAQGEKERPQLQLMQIGTPVDILMPPTDDFKGEFDEFSMSGSGSGDSGSKDSGTTDPMMDGGTDPTMSGDPMMDPMMMDTAPGYFESSGIIFAGGIQEIINDAAIQQRPRVDFVVTGIRNDIPVDVYLGYSKAKAPAPDFWDGQGFDLEEGQLELAPESLKIIAGVNLQPSSEPTLIQAGALDGFIGTDIGAPGAVRHQAALISVALEDLASIPDSEVYFQAIAVPAGNLDFSQGQASELDHYIIAKPEEGKAGSGTKAGESGKAATTDPTATDPNTDPNAGTGTDTGSK